MDSDFDDNDEIKNISNCSTIKDNNNEIKEKESNLKYFKGKKRFSNNFKKKKLSCHNEFVKNPLITKFNVNSKFIFDNDMADEYIYKVKDINYYKL